MGSLSFGVEEDDRLSALLAAAAPAATDSPIFVGSTSPRRQRVALERAAACARLCEENKGKDVLVLDTRSITTEFDFLVLATGNSRRQLHAMAEEIDDHMQGEQEARLGIEGYESCKWIVQDYGDIVVHLFDTFSRDYYRLEDLWGHGKKVEWQKY
jgi:ribosome-associated protein